MTKDAATGHPTIIAELRLEATARAAIIFQIRAAKNRCPGNQGFAVARTSRAPFLLRKG